jgi:hypothetical protein
MKRLEAVSTKRNELMKRLEAVSTCRRPLVASTLQTDGKDMTRENKRGYR